MLDVLFMYFYTEPSVESVHYLLLSGLLDGITTDNVEGYLSSSFEVNDVVLLGSGTARAEVVDDNERKILFFYYSLQKACINNPVLTLSQCKFSRAVNFTDLAIL